MALDGNARRRWVRRWAWAGVALLAALTAVAGGLGWSLRSGAMKPRLEAALADALNCDVSLDRLSVELFPKIRVTGTGLTVRLRDRPDANGLPPFIEARAFSVAVSYMEFRRRQIDDVRVDGLQLHIPPRAPDAETRAPQGATARLFRVGHSSSKDATVHFAGVTTGRRPLVFAIHDLEVSDAGIDRPMRFVARLTNPVPEVELTAIGTLGAWRRDDPLATPVGGGYRFDAMRLETINGLGGTATANGAFSGTLSTLAVTGTATVPDFSLDLGGAPRAVTATLRLTIDGNDGSTTIDDLQAVVGGTTVGITGQLVNLPGPKNIDVTARVAVVDGRIEDLLPLVIDAPKPFLTGGLTLDATARLPPGPARLRERVTIRGRFGVSGGRFGDKALRDQLREISRRGQGKKRQEDLATVATSLSGRVALAGGTARLTAIRFGVPGATVTLDGRYRLNTGAIDFVGTVALQASLSKAVGGFKSLFLKPLDPLFRREGAGAVIPIRISGTRASPKIGVRVMDALRRRRPPGAPPA